MKIKRFFSNKWRYSGDCAGSERKGTLNVQEMMERLEEIKSLGNPKTKKNFTHEE